MSKAQRKRDLDVVFVDGENLSRLEVATLCSRFGETSKYIYQTEAAAKKSGYPGFHHVVVPHIGKESVDKVIAMDAVVAWHRGAKKICIVSNDRDFGATALHLKRRFPRLGIMLLCDPRLVSAQYIDELTRFKIDVQPISESPKVDEFAAQVLEVIYELARGDTLSLAELGAQLKARGIEYKHLKKSLLHHRVIPANDFLKQGLIHVRPKQSPIVPNARPHRQAARPRFT